MAEAVDAKPVRWIASSLRDLRSFPPRVRDTVGFALYQAQLGWKHEAVKPLMGFGGAGVLEIVEDDDGSTYRAVYTVRFKGAVYVLHTFQKKSKRGIQTPRSEIDLIRHRLKMAEEDYQKRKWSHEAGA